MDGTRKAGQEQIPAQTALPAVPGREGRCRWDNMDRDTVGNDEPLPERRAKREKSVQEA
jgi:hypothetical protein